MPRQPPGFLVPRWPDAPRFRRRVASAPVGGLPNAPVDIPACWFSQPLQLRLDRPYNHAEVTQVDGNTARADNAASIATYRGVFPFTATLTTAVDADATNLAHWTVTYKGTPQTRAPLLVLNLLHRTDAEKLQILGVTRGQRIRIAGLPVEWPASARTLVVAGVTHAAAVTGRVVEWTTAPVLGASPTVGDTFSRTIVSDWGSADFGGAWTDTGGSASDYSVASGTGQVSLGTVIIPRRVTIGPAMADVDVVVTITSPVTAAGNRIEINLLARFVDGNNFYRAVVSCDTGGNLDLDVSKLVSGAFTTISSAANVIPYSPGVPFRVRLQVVGTTLRSRVWTVGTDEPTAWQVQGTATDLTAGQVGIRIALSSGNTNTLPVVLTFDDFTASTGGDNPQATAGPWFRWGTSSWGGSDTRPF